VHQLENENEGYKLQVEEYECQHRETVKEIKQLSHCSKTHVEMDLFERANAKLKVQV
jgi:hypothetical protein